MIPNNSIIYPDFFPDYTPNTKDVSQSQMSKAGWTEKTIETIMKEAEALNRADIELVVSAIANRSQEFGVSPEKTLHPDEFDGVNASMPKGNDSSANRQMIEDVISEVMTNGVKPEYKGVTFYAMPGHNIGVKGAQAVVTPGTAHVGYVDPKHGSVRTLDGWKQSQYSNSLSQYNEAFSQLGKTLGLPPIDDMSVLHRDINKGIPSVIPTARSSMMDNTLVAQDDWVNDPFFSDFSKHLSTGQQVQSSPQFTPGVIQGPMAIVTQDGKMRAVPVNNNIFDKLAPNFLNNMAMMKEALLDAGKAKTIASGFDLFPPNPAAALVADIVPKSGGLDLVRDLFGKFGLFGQAEANTRQPDVRSREEFSPAPRSIDVNDSTDWGDILGINKNSGWEAPTWASPSLADVQSASYRADTPVSTRASSSRSFNNDRINQASLAANNQSKTLESTRNNINLNDSTKYGDIAGLISGANWAPVEGTLGDLDRALIAGIPSLMEDSAPKISSMEPPVRMDVRPDAAHPSISALSPPDPVLARALSANQFTKEVPYPFPMMPVNKFVTDDELETYYSKIEAAKAKAEKAQSKIVPQIKQNTQRTNRNNPIVQSAINGIGSFVHNLTGGIGQVADRINFVPTPSSGGARGSDPVTGWDFYTNPSGVTTVSDFRGIPDLQVSSGGDGGFGGKG